MIPGMIGWGQQACEKGQLEFVVSHSAALPSLRRAQFGHLNFSSGNTSKNPGRENSVCFSSSSQNFSHFSLRSYQILNHRKIIPRVPPWKPSKISSNQLLDFLDYARDSIFVHSSCNSWVLNSSSVISTSL